MNASYRFRLILILAGMFVVMPMLGEASMPSYTLTVWPYGAIAWVGGIPEQAAAFVERLEQAVAHAFVFWGYESPTPSDTWRSPDQTPRNYPTEGGLPQVVLSDPATSADWRLDPLTWREEQIYPMVVIVFPDQQSLHDAIGRALPAYFFCSHGRVMDVELWIRPLMKKPRSMLCPIDAQQGTLVKEFAHWFAYERNASLFHTPPYIYEGVSEVTAMAFPDDSEGAEVDIVDWASRNCLSMCVASRSLTEAVGESFVGFLIDELGHEEFLDSFRSWAVDAYGMKAKYQGPWRVSLGLSSVCP